MFEVANFNVLTFNVGHFMEIIPAIASAEGLVLSSSSWMTIRFPGITKAFDQRGLDDEKLCSWNNFYPDGRRRPANSFLDLHLGNAEVGRAQLVACRWIQKRIWNQRGGKF